MAYERRRGRETAGGQRQERGGGVGLVWHRQGRPRRQGGAVLGLRRRPARLGRLDHAAKRRCDLQITPQHAERDRWPMGLLPAALLTVTSKKNPGGFPCFASVFALPPCCLSPAAFIRLRPRPPPLQQPRRRLQPRQSPRK